MRHLLVKAPRIRAWLRDFGVEDAGARREYATNDGPTKLHELSEQELDLLAELVAISAEYSETRDINGLLSDFHHVDQIDGSR